MNQPDVAELLRAVDSAEYTIWRHLQRIAAAYLELTNAVAYEQAKDALKSFKAAIKDLERIVFELLKAGGHIPDTLILNLNNQALRVWNLKVVDGLWMNCMHYYQRFVHAQTQSSKVRELTTLYYLLRDLSECSLEVKTEDYYGSSHALQSE